MRNIRLRWGQRPAGCRIEPLEDRQLLSSVQVSSPSMVFNAVKGSPSQTELLALTNTGSAAVPLNVSIAADPTAGTNDSAQFSLANRSSLPATLAPGASTTLDLTYTANTVGLQYAQLDISANGSTTVPLHGIGTAGTGGANQPSLMRILHAYDEPNYNQVGETDETSAYYPEPPAANSDEDDLQQMVKAGPGDVTLTVLASFVAAAPTPYVLGWYNTADGAGSRQQLFTTPQSESQSVYVQPQGTTSFDPGSATFGF